MDSVSNKTLAEASSSRRKRAKVVLPCSLLPINMIFFKGGSVRFEVGQVIRKDIFGKSWGVDEVVALRVISGNVGP